MKIANGIDLIEIDRVQRVIDRHGLRFLERVFTLTELAECGGRADSLAARYAAKEAVAKALGCGIGQIGWKEVEISRGPANEPRLKLYGAAAELAGELGLQIWSISLSHSATHAIAAVFAVGGV